MASLIVVSGPNEGAYYPLGSATLVIGRGETCPIQITDDLVSRKHLQIRREGDGYVALDMKSSNGTLINGRQVAGDIGLQDEDQIQIGNSKLVFSSQDFADRKSAFNHYKERGQRGRPTIGQ